MPEKEEDVVVKIPPKKKRTVDVKITSVEKGEPKRPPFAIYLPCTGEYIVPKDKDAERMLETVYKCMNGIMRFNYPYEWKDEILEVDFPTLKRMLFHEYMIEWVYGNVYHSITCGMIFDLDTGIRFSVEYPRNLLMLFDDVKEVERDEIYKQKPNVFVEMLLVYYRKHLEDAILIRLDLLPSTPVKIMGSYGSEVYFAVHGKYYAVTVKFPDTYEQQIKRAVDILGTLPTTVDFIEIRYEKGDFIDIRHVLTIEDVGAPPADDFQTATITVRAPGKDTYLDVVEEIKSRCGEYQLKRLHVRDA